MENKYNIILEETSFDNVFRFEILDKESFILFANEVMSFQIREYILEDFNLMVEKPDIMFKSFSANAKKKKNILKGEEGFYMSEKGTIGIEFITNLLKEDLKIVFTCEVENNSIKRSCYSVIIRNNKTSSALYYYLNRSVVKKLLKKKKSDFFEDLFNELERKKDAANFVDYRLEALKNLRMKYDKLRNAKNLFEEILS